MVSAADVVRLPRFPEPVPGRSGRSRPRNRGGKVARTTEPASGESERLPHRLVVFVVIKFTAVDSDAGGAAESSGGGNAQHTADDVRRTRIGIGRGEHERARPGLGQSSSTSNDRTDGQRARSAVLVTTRSVALPERLPPLMA